MNASSRNDDEEASADKSENEKKPKNTAPDAVKDPSEKTDGKPGLPAGSKDGDDADPGGG